MSRGYEPETAATVLSCGLEFVEDVAPPSPLARFAPPDDEIPAGRIDRRTLPGNHRLFVRPDVDRVVALHEQILAMNRQRRDVELRHLFDEDRASAVSPVDVGRAGKHEPYVVRHDAERQRGIAGQPSLPVLRGGSDNGRAVGERSWDVPVLACADQE